MSATPALSGRRQRRTTSMADSEKDVAALHREYLETRDPVLANQLVEFHCGLAHRLATRFANRGEAPEDLTQVAMLGLVKAIDGFDPDRGLRFSTYATPTILREVK